MAVDRVSPQQALDLIRDEGYAYIDVRSVPEFKEGHPEGAYNVPLVHMGPTGHAANPDFVAVVEQHFPRDAPLILGCRTANRSEHAAVLLLRAGYTRLVIQRAGFSGTRDPWGRVDPGWAPSGLPTSQEAEPGRSWDELHGAKG